jgi:hypothetical protein
MEGGIRGVRASRLAPASAGGRIKTAPPAVAQAAHASGEFRRPLPLTRARWVPLPSALSRRRPPSNRKGL